MVSEPLFNAAFEKVCNEFAIPITLHKKIHKVILKNLNDSRTASKMVADILPFNWKHELISPCLLGENKQDYSKEHISFLVSRIVKLNRIYEQWERIKKTKKTLPNLLLSRGTTLQDCPVHKDDYDKIFAVDDEYWITHPIAEHLICRCTIRVMTDFELNNPR